MFILVPFKFVGETISYNSVDIMLVPESNKNSTHAFTGDTNTLFTQTLASKSL